MELIVSIIAIVISLISIIVSVVIYRGEVQREKKEATLNAYNVLQEQALDNINQYKKAEIKEICDEWKKIIDWQKKMEKEGSRLNFTAKQQEWIEKYNKLSGYLARIEHFALGVNTGIYDAKTAERAGTYYIINLHKKLEPLIEGKGGAEFYGEFKKLVDKIAKIEKKRRSGGR